MLFSLTEQIQMKYNITGTLQMPSSRREGGSLVSIVRSIVHSRPERQRKKKEEEIKEINERIFQELAEEINAKRRELETTRTELSRTQRNELHETLKKLRVNKLESAVVLELKDNLEGSPDGLSERFVTEFHSYVNQYIRKEVHDSAMFLILSTVIESS